MAQYSIKNGPSKFDLMIALFHRHEEKQHHRVHFVLEDGRKIEAIITAVSIEDGSRESWLIQGWFPNTDPKLSTKYFTGYFDTRSRTGYLKFD